MTSAAPRIIDISQPLGATTPEWPGDAPFRLAWTMRRERGDSVNVAEIASTVHIGTHADGPGHTLDGRPAIGSVALEPYLGPAVVVHADGASALQAALLDGLDLERTPRVLLRARTPAQAAASGFQRDFAALTPGLARALVERGARLVGTDSPSVDPFDSKDLEAHGILTGGGVAILENLALQDVPEGEYTLIALPLKLVDADSSPVRAVLVGPGGLAL
ncbi:MAG TPA: cyclase family protein [Longimicrobiales bacterium]